MILSLWLDCDCNPISLCEIVRVQEREKNQRLCVCYSYSEIVRVCNCMLVVLGVVSACDNMTMCVVM